MKRYAFTVMTYILVASCLGTPAFAGFEAGMNAYRKRDFATAMREFKSSTDVPQANYNIGVMYFKGEGVQQDKKEGARWLKKAAEQGHPNAQFLLSAIYFSGDGVDRKIPEAVKWIKKSAKQGLPEAQFRLGMMLINGDNIDKDREQGLMWVKKAAKQGHVNAKKLLTVMGESGKMPKGHPAMPAK